MDASAAAGAGHALGLRAERKGVGRGLVCDDLQQHELGVRACRQVGRPRDGAAGRLGAIGCNDDPLHVTIVTRRRAKPKQSSYWASAFSGSAGLWAPLRPS